METLNPYDSESFLQVTNYNMNDLLSLAQMVRLKGINTPEEWYLGIAAILNSPPHPVVRLPLTGKVVLKPWEEVRKATQNDLMYYRYYREVEWVQFTDARLFLCSELVRWWSTVLTVDCHSEIMTVYHQDRKIYSTD
jgi:hypothetical protein